MFLFGILITVLLMIRYENIPYFAMRAWMYITLLIMLYIFYKYAKLYKVDYPREKINAQKSHTTTQENKYLPNKN